MFKAISFVIALVSLPVSALANGGLGAPLIRPDHREVVARLAEALPPSIYGDYIGVTPAGRWCQMSVGTNGWEYYVSISQAIPGTLWAYGRPTQLSNAVNFGLRSAVNATRVTEVKEVGNVLTVSYEQILPPFGVNLQTVYGGTINILRNRHGRPSRVEVIDREYDRWNDFVMVRSLSCGEPIAQAQ